MSLEKLKQEYEGSKCDMCKDGTIHVLVDTYRSKMGMCSIKTGSIQVMLEVPEVPYMKCDKCGESFYEHTSSHKLDMAMTRKHIEWTLEHVNHEHDFVVADNVDAAMAEIDERHSSEMINWIHAHTYNLTDGKFLVVFYRSKRDREREEHEM